MTNVLLHEARHAYQASRAAASGNDQDGDFLVVNIPIAPMTIFIDTTAPRNVCNQKAGQVQSLAYHGDNLYDQAGSPDFASYAWEMDAWTFAAAHDH